MKTSESIRPDQQTTAVPDGGLYPIGGVLQHKIKDHVALLYCEYGNLAISFPIHGIMRMTYFTADAPDLQSTVAIAAELSPQFIETAVSVEKLTLSAAGLELSVSLSNTVCTVTESATGHVMARDLSVSVTTTGEVNLIGAALQSTHFYGLGEKTSFLDKRGESYTMWNSDVYDPHVPEIDALYVSIPFLITFEAARAAGLFLDNPGKSEFDMRKHKNTYEIRTKTGGMDVFVIAGPAMKDVVSRYTELTGRMSMPPKWAIGYHQSRYSYMSQDEVLELAQEFRKRDIPLDAIHLDIHYMDGYRVFTFDRDRFPDPKAMMAELEKLGIKIVPIVDPGIKQDNNYAVYRDGVESDRFCKDVEGDIFNGEVWPAPSAFPDFTDDEVAQWWGEQHKFYVDLGVRGIWNDMNEPAVFNEIKTMEPHIIHRNNGQPKTHEELHNLYGMLMSRATYIAMVQQLQGKRPFLLTRAGYAGVQRYAAIWTGDNRSFWEHMELAVPMVLNLGLSGITFTGPDVGGFAHHTSGQLLARWTQMGAFFPFFRNHSALDTVRQEPWAFGEEIEVICRKYIQLRYQWMPYLYSLFAEAVRTGIPVMRPLVLEYPTDENTYNLSDEFLVGKDVLVAPVFRPDTGHRMVYLPDGVWFDYWTGDRHDGGRHILVNAPLDTLPLFVRAGTITPLGPVYQSAAGSEGFGSGETDKVDGGWLVDNEVVFHVFLDDTGLALKNSFTYYDDDGETFAYRNGNYLQAEITLEDTGTIVTLTCRSVHAPDGFHQAEEGGVQYKFCIHGLKQNTEVRGLTHVSFSELDRCSEGWAYDETHGTIEIRVPSLAVNHCIDIRRQA